MCASSISARSTAIPARRASVAPAGRVSVARAAISHLAVKRGLAPLSSRAAIAGRAIKGARSNGARTFAVAVPAGADQPGVEGIQFGGLQGKALNPPATYPTRAEVFGAIPEDCYKRETMTSMLYAVISTVLTVGTGLLAYNFIPLTAAYIPAWIAYAAINGTIGTGMWVVAHECGHGAFSDNKFIQDLVGYVMHTALLVPYFSWQRSHAVHHSRTNHLTEGETHVPYQIGEMKGDKNLALKEAVGSAPFAIINGIFHLVFGWPAYLLFGATGGPKYGVTNHLWPYAPFSGKLFPGGWKPKVIASALGVAAMGAVLAKWAAIDGALKVFAVYFGPYIGVNFWLVLYTWLQHTDVDVPHYDGKDWDWVKGAFLTIDRPYGAVLDFLHHRIGSTHVAHHVAHTIPHYKAVKATNALKEAFPDLYLYDPTPIHVALWRVCSECVAIRPRGTDDGQWVFQSRKNIADVPSPAL